MTLDLSSLSRELTLAVTSKLIWAQPRAIDCNHHCSEWTLAFIHWFIVCIDFHWNSLKNHSFPMHVMSGTYCKKKWPLFNTIRRPVIYLLGTCYVWWSGCGKSEIAIIETIFAYKLYMKCSIMRFLFFFWSSVAW